MLARQAQDIANLATLDPAFDKGTDHQSRGVGGFRIACQGVVHCDQDPREAGVALELADRADEVSVALLALIPGGAMADPNR